MKYYLDSRMLVRIELAVPGKKKSASGEALFTLSCIKSVQAVFLQELGAPITMLVGDGFSPPVNRSSSYLFPSGRLPRSP